VAAHVRGCALGRGKNRVGSAHRAARRGVDSAALGAATAAYVAIAVAATGALTVTGAEFQRVQSLLTRRSFWATQIATLALTGAAAALMRFATPRASLRVVWWVACDVAIVLCGALCRWHWRRSHRPPPPTLQHTRAPVAVFSPHAAAAAAAANSAGYRSFSEPPPAVVVVDAHTV